MSTYIHRWMCEECEREMVAELELPVPDTGVIVNVTCCRAETYRLTPQATEEGIPVRMDVRRL
jgi:hypothetical protein